MWTFYGILKYAENDPYDPQFMVILWESQIEVCVCVITSSVCVITSFLKTLKTGVKLIRTDKKTDLFRQSC